MWLIAQNDPKTIGELHKTFEEVTGRLFIKILDTWQELEDAEMIGLNRSSTGQRTEQKKR